VHPKVTAEQPARTHGPIVITGKVTKAYEDTHKGKKTWEVRISGDDGKKWEVYYEIATGALVDAKSE